jgi:hypothetical protein
MSSAMKESQSALDAPVPEENVKDISIQTEPI